MIDFLAAIADESRRLATAATECRELGDPTTLVVPSCPDWSVDDLVWHLAEVQYFWASIVEGRLDDPSEVVPLVRPGSAELIELFIGQSERLVAVSAEAEPSESCWSWYGPGHNVGWVRRRQAHEALIHRLDAELARGAAGGPAPGPIDAELAADGVDEILRVMLGVDPLPDWATWTEDGPEIALVATVAGGQDRSWAVRPGRFVGPEPGGEQHDFAAIRVAPDGASPDQRRDAKGPAATVRGPAAELDAWLWRRGPLDRSILEGDRALIDRLPDLAELD